MIGRARHHSSHVGDTRVGAQALRTARQAEPDRADALELAAERAIVDQRGADLFDSADRRERVAAHQHAAARGGGGRGIRPVHPRERVEHLEEEDERRDQRTLGERLAAQLRHQRCQHQAAVLRAPDERCERIGRIGDVRIGEQKVGRGIGQAFDMIDALLHGPEFSGPAGRKRCPGHDGEATGGAFARSGRARGLRGAVAALIVDEDDREQAGIVLMQERG